MGSTGVYWWPVYHALAQTGQIEVCVANAAHMRDVPGRKTGIGDCQWIAELHEHALLRPSFIPTAEVAALRQRTRYRKKLIEQRACEGQRLSKVLEDAGIKIDSVASELLGVPGRAMIEALAAGERDPRRLAALAKGRLRAKLDALEMACDGRFTEAHGQMRRLHLGSYDRLSEQIATLDALVAEAAAPFAAVLAWVGHNSVPISALAETAIARRLLGEATGRLDGKNAATSTVRRHRIILANAMDYAVELGLLETNPIRALKWTTPKVSSQVDRLVGRMIFGMPACPHG